MATHPEDLLTPAEAARLADVTPASIRAWADAGRLPCLRTAGGLRLFRRADVQHHMADREARGARVGRQGALRG